MTTSDLYHFVAESRDARMLRVLADMVERGDAMVTVEVEEDVPGGEQLGSNIQFSTWLPKTTADDLLPALTEAKAS